MRKIIVSNLVTVDGYFCGPNGEIDWHNVDAEFNEYAIEMLNSLDTLIFGRVTYDLMAGYWPAPDGPKDDPIVAGKMNSLEKLVFSKTQEKLAWNNSRVLTEINPDVIKKIKQEPGKDMAIFGSGTIVQAFTNFGLIDEYRLIVNPIILGSGKLLFANIEKKLNLKLINEKKFKSGNVLLCYEPARSGGGK